MDRFPCWATRFLEVLLRPALVCKIPQNIQNITAKYQMKRWAPFVLMKTYRFGWTLNLTNITSKFTMSALLSGGISPTQSILHVRFIFLLDLKTYSNYSIQQEINLLWCHRDHSGYGISQWETTLQCNVVSHWLSPYTKWSLCHRAPYTFTNIDSGNALLHGEQQTISRTYVD